MALETFGHYESFPASGDLSAKQFYAVDITTSGRVILCSAAGQRAIGIVANKPGSATDSIVSVRVLDGTKTKAIAGGSITSGNLLKVDSAGKLVAASAAVVNTSDAGAASDPVIGSYVVGIACQDASSGDIFTFLSTPLGAVPTTAA